MSHFTEMTVLFLQKNEPMLLEALREQFGQDGVEVHDEAQTLNMWTGQESQLGNGDYASQPCHIIVRRDTLRSKGGGLTNDCGYRRNEKGGYEAYIDEAGFSQELQDLVAQDYTARVSQKALKAKGYEVRLQKTPEGVLQVVGTKY